MRKKIATLTLLASLLTAPALFAQESRGGIKAGLNMSNLYIDNAESESLRISYHAGLFGQIMNNDNVIGAQLEFLLSSKGARANYNTLFGEGEYRFNLAYVDIPILGVIKAGDVLEFHGGWYFGYLVAASTYQKGDFDEEYDELARDEFQPMDYGFCLGGAVNISHLTLGARYNIGIQEIAKSEEARDILGDAKNSYFQVFMGLSFD